MQPLEYLPRLITVPYVLKGFGRILTTNVKENLFATSNT